MAFPENDPRRNTDNLQGTAGVLSYLPYPVQRSVARIADWIHSSQSDALEDILGLERFDPFLLRALLEARDKPLPKKPELEAKAKDILRINSNHHLTSRLPSLKRYVSDEFLPEHAPHTFVQRISTGITSHDIRYGLPIQGVLVTNNPQRRLIGWNFDTLLLRDMYWDYAHVTHVSEHLAAFTEKMMEAQVPWSSQKTIDRHRFLGYQNEETFRREIEQQLLFRMRNRGINTSQVKEFMRFAQESDAVRLKQKGDNTRKTHEHWYCHYLATAWYLWTMIEDDLENDPVSLAEAADDVALAFTHEIPEDLETNFHREDASYIPTDTTLLMEGSSLPLHLNREQWIILKSLTKIGKEDGARWLERIKELPSKRLIRRAARIKAADRFANLPTLPFTSDNFFDAYRKLEETRLSGGQLLYLAHYADQGVFTTYTDVRHKMRTNRLTTFLTALPILAEIEQKILLAKFGLVYQESLSQIHEPWARYIVSALKTHVTNPKKRSDAPLPPYRRRLEELASSYHLSELESRYIMPLIELENYLGLEYFVQDEQFGAGNGPLEFKHYVPLVIRSETFLRFFSKRAKGVQPGGLDTIFFPNENLATAFWNQFYNDTNDLFLGYITLTEDQAKKMKLR
ncbi:hypothetical protein HYW55_01230 [Candidatus Gottesmanbacteria bacterium]|nr:hypothetical protein [Candidatus Gottesmanbacteria bacterium]